MGIKFTNISKSEVQDQSQTSVSIWNKDIVLFGTSFSNKAKEDFYGELSVLLHSGINLKQALEIISEMQKKGKNRDLIDSLGRTIDTGKSFSQALETHTYFSPYEYQAIHIGEQTGKLKDIAEDLREYFARKNELRRELISSLSYPVIILLLAVGVVIFMLSAVVPMFVDIFNQNKVDLPWLTQKIVELSAFVSENDWTLVLSFIMMIILLKWISTTDWYYKFTGRVQMKIPVLSNYIRKIYLIQFNQMMTLLTTAKIPVVSSLAMVRNMIRFYPLEQSLVQIEQDILKGEKIYKSFAKHSIYDRKMIALLRVAEETNQTEYIFQKLYDQYRTELKHKGKIITNVLNFVLILFVGALVGVILVAMYLPMFKLSSVIG